jgi:predicted choloylglycine hydrolase
MVKDAHMMKETYRFINLAGSHYEVGHALGERLRNHARLKPYFITGEFDPKGTAFESFSELQDFCESFCPGITEETQGFADSLGVRPEQVAYYHNYLVPRHTAQACSQFAVLPSATKDGSIYVGRNYEYHPSDEDLCLLMTRVRGKHSHLGFSMQGLGRGDGMNSEGLVVTMTGGGIEFPATNRKAFIYTFAIRTLLDNCASTDEATDMLCEMPVYWSTIFLIVDRSGKAALVEGIDSKYAARYAGEGIQEPFFFSTNHYTHPQMVSYNKYINEWLMSNSQTRHKTLTAFFERNAQQITKEQIFTLLKTEMPDGLCAHYYSEFFGTLWSMVFDVTRGCADVCFGPPTHNPYRHFDMRKSFHDEEYEVLLPDKKS